MSLAPQRQTRPRVLGPCFVCGQFGHLARTCPTKGRQYPFYPPVVSSADAICVTAEFSKLSGSRQGIDDCIAESHVVDECTDEWNLVGTECVNSTKEIIDTSVGHYGTSVTGRLGNLGLYDLQKFWEMDDTAVQLPVQITDVQGRLKQRIEFWHEVLQAPPSIIDCIENGYRLPLKFIPPPYSQQNHKSVELFSEFVDDALQNLMSNRCIMRVEAKPEVCSPLSVVANSQGKLRLVLNLRYLNQFLHVVSFKYEDLCIAALMFEQGEYLFKFDLKSGYHHVDIWPEHYKFLGFRWDTDRVNYYVFKVLPFGLSTACYLFTKLMRPLVRHWRSRGLKSIIYLDDGIIAVKGEAKARLESKQVERDLEQAGFIVNIEKSVWEPSQRVEWLGFNIDLALGEFSVPTSKIEMLKENLAKAMHARLLPAKQLASLIGKIMSMSPALGSVTRLMTHSLYAALDSRIGWCHKLLLPDEALQEIEFWHSEIANFNGKHIWPKPSVVRVVYSDASSTGYGGYVVEHGNLIANGQWSLEDVEKSSTWCELRAVHMVLESFQDKLKNERLRWFSDNQNVTRIVLHGSRQPALQSEALSIFATCLRNNIRVEPEWIPREENELADYYSRVVEYDDYMLHPVLFQWLDNIWGPHTVDRFANPVNAKIERFNSRFWNPGTDAIDAFTCNWAEDNNWWFPPVYLIPRVVRYAQRSGASGTLIAPQWKSSPFWPLIFPNGVDPADFVVGYLVLPNSENLILPGQSGTSLFKGLPNTPMLALRLEFQL